MDVVILGMGYVGLTVAACLLDRGHLVIGVDPVERKVRLVRDGVSPLNEPGVGDLLAAGRSANRLFADTTPIPYLLTADMVQICVGTPSGSEGDLDHAQVEEAAREIGQAGTLMYTLCHVAIPEILAGRVAAAQAHAEELSSLGEDKGAPLWRGAASILRGWTSSLTSHEADAAEMIAAGLDAYAATGGTVFSPIFRCALARAHAACGRVDAGQKSISEALDHILDQMRQEILAPKIMSAMLGSLVRALGADGAAVLDLADTPEISFVLHSVGAGLEQFIPKLRRVLEGDSGPARSHVFGEGRRTHLAALGAPFLFGLMLNHHMALAR